jgi:hypothetical protein
MKTTIDIPDTALSRLLTLTKAHTKREAILCAVSEFNRRHAIAELVASFGTWDVDANETIESADLTETGVRL